MRRYRVVAFTVPAIATGVPAFLSARSPQAPTAELFAPGIVSTPLDELDSVFTRDGRELSCSISMPGDQTGAIVVSRRRKRARLQHPWRSGTRRSSRSADHFRRPRRASRYFSRMLEPHRRGLRALVVSILLGLLGPTAAPAQVRHGPADVTFMQGMIAHHDQAVAMVALVPARTKREDFRLLAERIEVSQRDEIELMRQWLRRRGEAGRHDAHHDDAMPGMATPDEMERLTRSRGAAFERLFLELMIRHHEGALEMVRELFATSGAGQEPEIFRFASDVDADQRAEIARMRAMLEGLTSGRP